MLQKPPAPPHLLRFPIQLQLAQRECGVQTTHLHLTISGYL